MEKPCVKKEEENTTKIEESAVKRIVRCGWTTFSFFPLLSCSLCHLISLSHLNILSMFAQCPRNNMHCASRRF